MGSLISFGALLKAVSQDPAKGDYAIIRRGAIECDARARKYLLKSIRTVMS